MYLPCKLSFEQTCFSNSSGILRHAVANLGAGLGGFLPVSPELSFLEDDMAVY